jgi:DNA-binding FadR family transcriptional regulator
MDLRIHGGGYATGAHDAQLQKRRPDYEALAKAISEGNLPGANDAYAEIIGQLPAGGRISPESFLGRMGVALRSADLALARQLMAGAGARGGALAVNSAEADAAANAQRAAGEEASPALALNQAIQSGDPAKARVALQIMIDDLRQIADMGLFSGSGLTGAKAYATAAAPVSAAAALLQNPNFQALEAAIGRGDPTGMRTAWAFVMSGAMNERNTAKKTTPPTTTENSAVVWDLRIATAS